MEGRTQVFDRWGWEQSFQQCSMLTAIRYLKENRLFKFNRFVRTELLTIDMYCLLESLFV